MVKRRPHFVRKRRPFRDFCLARSPQDVALLQQLEEIAGPCFENLSQQQLMDLKAVLAIWATFEENTDPAILNYGVHSCGDAAWKVGLEPEPLLDQVFGLCSALPENLENFLAAIQNTLDSRPVRRRGGDL